jgi:hypothetical protein
MLAGRRVDGFGPALAWRVRRLQANGFARCGARAAQWAPPGRAPPARRQTGSARCTPPPRRAHLLATQGSKREARRGSRPSRYTMSSDGQKLAVRGAAARPRAPAPARGGGAGAGGAGLAGGEEEGRGGQVGGRLMQSPCGCACGGGGWQGAVSTFSSRGRARGARRPRSCSAPSALSPPPGPARAGRRAAAGPARGGAGCVGRGGCAGRRVGIGAIAECAQCHHRNVCGVGGAW